MYVTTMVRYVCQDYRPMCVTLQGGQDAQDALSCTSLSAREPLFIGLFRGKNTRRAAARRTAPKLPRAIRVGPNEGGKKTESLLRGFICTGGGLSLLEGIRHGIGLWSTCIVRRLCQEYRRLHKLHFWGLVQFQHKYGGGAGVGERMDRLGDSPGAGQAAAEDRRRRAPPEQDLGPRKIRYGLDLERDWIELEIWACWACCVLLTFGVVHSRAVSCTLAQCAALTQSTCQRFGPSMLLSGEAALINR